MRCPRDKTTLNSHRQGVVDLHTCARCRGLWFTKESMQRVLLLDGFKSDIFTRVGQGMWSRRTQRKQDCPTCGEIPLVARQVGEVEVDVCPVCYGIWFDSGELDAIIRRHRERREPTIVTRDRRYTVADGILDLAGNADSIVDLGRVLHEVLASTPELAGEAAAAVAEFLAEIFGSVVS